MKKSKNINSVLVNSLLFSIIFFITINNIHSSNWYNNDWTYRKKITFTDNSDTIPDQQTDFPVLISITDENLKNNATDTGYDILFADSDGISKLAHEIEYYDSGTGQLICWVKMPVLYTGKIIYMYYGNDTATEQQDIHNVWTNNYAGVWHMDDYIDTMIKDSTLYGNHGIKYNNPTEVAGIVRKAQEFNGINSYISILNAASLNISTNITISCWIIVNNSNTTPDILTKGNYDESYSVWARDTNSIRAALNNNTITGSFGAATNWRYVTVTRNQTIGGQRKIFINGNAVVSDTFNTNITTVGGNLFLSTITYPLNGLMDEVRLSNTSRSSEWIKTKYNNQNDPSTFYNLSVEQKNTDISINFPEDNYETDVINITVSGTVLNYYEGDTVEIFVGNNMQDTVILSGIGTDTVWVLNITLLKPSDSITVRLIDINDNQYFDTITITKLPPQIPTGIDATAILQGSATGVLLSWIHNFDADTAGYNIYRTADPLNFSDTINQNLITDTNFYFDTNVVQGETYFYKITCVDKVGNESQHSDSITASSVKIKLSVDTYGRTLPGDTLTLYFNYYNDGFGPAYGANLFYNIPENLIFDNFIENANVYTTYDTSLKRLEWEFKNPILPKLESDSKNIEVILKIK